MKQTKKEQIALSFSFLSITDVGHERFINVFCVVYPFGWLSKAFKNIFNMNPGFGG